LEIFVAGQSVSCVAAVGFTLCLVSRPIPEFLGANQGLPAKLFRDSGLLESGFVRESSV
jgi:hypothetical protein